MNDYYKGLIKDVRDNYEIIKNSSLEELIATFKYYLQENAELEKENRKLKRKLEKLNESYEMFRRFLYHTDLAYKESQQKNKWRC